MKVLSFFKELFDQSETETGAAGSNLTPAVPSPPAAEPISLSLPNSGPMEHDKAIESLVEQHRDASTPLVAGTFELVGLEELEAALGDQWPYFSERAAKLAEEGIRERLEEGDVLHRQSHTGFAIYFAKLDRSLASDRARQISQEIRQIIISKIPEFSALEIDHYTIEIDTSKIASGTQNLTDRLLDTMRVLRSESDLEISQYKHRILKDFHMLFSPVWNPSLSIVDLNRCVLDLSKGLNTLAQFQAIADPDQMIGTLADMDCIALTRAIENLHRHGKAAAVSKIIVPVGYQTLSDRKACVEYFKILGSIPRSYKMFIRLEIINIPQALDVNAFNKILADTGRMLPSLVLQSIPQAPYLDKLDTSSLWGVSWNLVSSHHRTTLKSVSPDAYWGFAKARHLRTLAYGANTIGLALSAADRGFDYISGTAIHLPQETPKPPGRLRPLIFPRATARYSAYGT